ncbi:hypothetical protein SFRURICE_011076, partial [Spodoptera frugiperda]
NTKILSQTEYRLGIVVKTVGDFVHKELGTTATTLQNECQTAKILAKCLNLQIVFDVKYLHFVAQAVTALGGRDGAMAQGDKFWGAPTSQVGVSCLSWCKPSEPCSTLCAYIFISWYNTDHLMLNNRRSMDTAKQQRHDTRVAVILRVKNLRVVGESVFATVVKGGNWASSNLIHTIRYNAGFVSLRISVRPWYQSITSNREEAWFSHTF